MPGFDRTGPMGYGPMTGRGLGPCGRGFRRGAGRGFGRGPWCPQPYGYYQPTKEEEIKILEAELKEIEARLKELKETK